MVWVAHTHTEWREWKIHVHRLAHAFKRFTYAQAHFRDTISAFDFSVVRLWATVAQYLSLVWSSTNVKNRLILSNRNAAKNKINPRISRLKHIAHIVVGFFFSLSLSTRSLLLYRCMFRFTSAKPEKESNSVCQITRFNLNAHTMGYIIPVLQKYSKFARFASLYAVCMFASRMLLSFLSIALFPWFSKQSKPFWILHENSFESLYTKHFKRFHQSISIVG